MAVHAAPAAGDERPALLRILDPAGRARGTGFAADTAGTVVTSHEAVDGLPRLLLRAPSGATREVTAAAVTPLPDWGLALVHAPGLDAAPLVLGADRAEAAAAGPVPVRLVLAGAAGGARLTATLTGAGPAVYTATNGRHPVAEALLLDLPPGAAAELRRHPAHPGSPLTDPDTGAVVGVVVTALHAAGGGPRRGRALAVSPRAAAALEPDGPLTRLLRRNDADAPGTGPDLNLAGVLRLTAATGPAPASAAGGAPPPDRADAAEALAAFDTGRHTVLALTGPPGTGRTTALAAHTARRRTRGRPAPTLWLRGADLRADDGGLRDAVARALGAAAPGTDPDVAARTARDAGRPLLVVLDGPEEMPPALLARLPRWTAATAGWLRAGGTRLALACRPEFWETAGPLYPPGSARAHPVGDLPAGAGREGRHPLSLRMLAEVRAAQPEAAPGPDTGRHEIFTAHLDLVALRVADTLTGPATPGPAARRRLAAHVAGRVHEAARRSLATGELSPRAFEALFPWPGGWARAVLDQGVLVSAGAGYRFADEEFADWLHGLHLDVDAALAAAARGRVPRHRAGTVVQALLHRGRHHGPPALRCRLRPLLDRLAPPAAAPGEPHADWWARHLLREVFLALPDAGVLMTELRLLADRLAGHGPGGPWPDAFGAAFWPALALPVAERLDLLRRALPADRPRTDGGGRLLRAAGDLLAAEPGAVAALVAGWLGDERPLPGTGGVPVGTAAQALLYVHRHRAPDDLVEALAADGRPRADELLAELAREDPAALCRAVHRWAGDDRPARRLAAAVHALRTLPHVRCDADRALLRHAAQVLLARPEDAALHAGAFRLLARTVTDALPPARPARAG